MPETPASAPLRLVRTEALLETFFRLAREGKVDRKGNPGLLQLALIAREFEQEGYATRPPLAALGYRAP